MPDDAKGPTKGRSIYTIECPKCGKMVKSLGYASHRAMHYRMKQRALSPEKKEPKP